MSPRIDPSAVERSRPAGVPADGGGEAALAFALRAAGVEEPVRELHFAWCCEHGKKVHGAMEDFFGVGRSACVECYRSVIKGCVHAYSHERDWRFDFAWPAQRVAVEVEGGTWVSGRHSRGKGYEEDAVKYSEAAIRGWAVIRVTTAMVDDGRALELVERALAARSRA